MGLVEVVGEEEDAQHVHREERVDEHRVQQREDPVLRVDIEEEDGVVEHHHADQQDEGPLLLQGPLIPRVVEPCARRRGGRGGGGVRRGRDGAGRMA